MSESRHTPGPWFVLPDLTVRVREWSRCAQMGDADGCIICDLRPALGVSDDDGERGQEAVDLARRVRAHAVGETDANARLIAAAPELLAALKVAVGRMFGHDKYQCQGDCSTCTAIKAARALIAKVEGGAS